MRAVPWRAALVATLAVLTSEVHAQTSLCATVKIEIAQELTLERQAFDARMRIGNGLDSVALENVEVQVVFSDDEGAPVVASSDPNDVGASFFIRVDSLDGISDVDGAGTVAPSTSAEIHWLIIPNPGAGGSLPQGKRYNVGATLRYNLGGVPQEVVVAPDWITVAPQPLLVLDYFLTRDVFADEPFTKTEVEVAEPFTLGVRVRNTGFGSARRVAIDSAQPRIVENELGLLIGFALTGSSVDDQPAAPTLRLNFGDIDAQRSRVGRWVMETTLSGRFTEFSARFSHADELGGRLTSLIDSVNTHSLVRDVRVDLPGRDSVRDFLALDGGTLRLYESDSVDTLVTDRSAVSTLTPLGGDRYALSVPLTAGPLYAKMSDPGGGERTVLRVTRSDGKVLPTENGWTSKTGNGHIGFQHFLNVFDVNGGGTYTIELGTVVVADAAPVLQFIPDRTVPVGQRLSFIVEASDPNGTIPSLRVASLPVGATFTDQGNGRGVFDWTPSSDQMGTFPITYRASDGALSSARTAQIIVGTGGTPTATPSSTPSQTATSTQTLTPTQTPTATPTPVCAASPRACRAPGKSILLLKDKAKDASDKLIWKWLKGEATTFGDLGAPTTATAYDLCVYAGPAQALVAHLSVPAGGNWRTLGSTGYAYMNAAALPSGLQKLKVKSGDTGKAQALVIGKGAALPDLSLPVAPPLTVQLTNSGGVCWGTSYDSANLSKNDATQVKAKEP